MKLFRQLLVAPAALGLLAPVAATAADLNINDVSTYSSSSKQRVESISQFSDVYPTDWAHQALTSMLERHGCAPMAASGSMTRYEVAAALNKCLVNVPELNAEERHLVNEFSSEIALIQGRMDGVEAGMAPGDSAFASTTKVSGSTTFVFGGVDGTTASENLDAAVFVYDTALALETSFNGSDLLVTEIVSGNYGDTDPFGCSGVAALEACTSTSNQLTIDKSYYQLPVGDNVTVTVGAKIRQDDMLAVWPSDYPSDTVLDVLTYAGANAAYALAEGAGAGVSYVKDEFSASLLFVSSEANSANETTSGLLTTYGSDDVTGQLAWSAENFTIAGVLTTSDAGQSNEDGVGEEPATMKEDFTAYGISGVYQFDADSDFIPASISGGMGWKYVDNEENHGGNSSNDVDDERTWSVGLLWDDVWKEGYTLGVAVGTAEGWRDDSGYDDPIALELFYSMQLTDNITVTPALFSIQRNDVDGNNYDDVQGALVKTTFSF